jgi:winged helix DNA-binding protein
VGLSFVTTPVKLTRKQVLGHRRRIGALDERLPKGKRSLRQAAWAGLPDSMPRAALHSIHARVEGTNPETWADPSLVQLWGPRYSVFVVAARDLAPFSLGTMPDDAKGRRRAEDLAARLHELLDRDEKRITYSEAGRALGVHPNSLRYAAATGTVLIRWEGARAPTIWTVPAPEMSEQEARLELVRRYLHVYGPTTVQAFRRWAGIGVRGAVWAFEELSPSLTPVRTPIGEAWILSSDEASFRAAPGPPAAARLLPSGDAYCLFHGADRELVLPDARQRNQLWTSRVWPGAVLVDGEIVGTWRRSQERVDVSAWRRLSRAQRDAVVVEAESLPLPGLRGRTVVRWES